MAILALAGAFWGSVVWLTALRGDMTGIDADLLTPEEAEELPLDRPFVEPGPNPTYFPGQPRHLGLAFGTPRLILTGADNLTLLDDRAARPQREEP